MRVFLLSFGGPWGVFARLSFIPVYRKWREETILAPITWFFLYSMESIYSRVERQNGVICPTPQICGALHIWGVGQITPFSCPNGDSPCSIVPSMIGFARLCR